jgi:WD40 repeat protein
MGWDTKRVQRRNRFETLPIPVAQLVFLPDTGDMLSVDQDGYVTLWDSQTLQMEESLNTLGPGVEQLLISSDGTRVFAGTRGGEVIILDWPSRQVITTLGEGSGRSDSLRPVALIDDERTLVVVAGGRTVRLVDTASWQTRAQWPIDTEGPWFGKRHSVSAESDLLATGGIRAPLHFLNLGTGQAQTIETTQPWGASDLAFSPDGRLLATASLEGTIRLWDTSSLEVIDVLRGHLIGVNAVAFSPNGHRLASSSQGDEAVKLWDVSARQEVVTLPGEGLIAGGMAFSSDGNMLVAVNAQGKAHIWWAPSFAEIAAAESGSDAPHTSAVVP